MLPILQNGSAGDRSPGISTADTASLLELKSWSAQRPQQFQRAAAHLHVQFRHGAEQGIRPGRIARHNLLITKRAVVNPKFVNLAIEVRIVPLRLAQPIVYILI